MGRTVLHRKYSKKEPAEICKTEGKALNEASSQALRKSTQIFG
ncbi:hypothetical protein HMPREF7215_2410 [Pyramidobacter piscolens W5455]|uniref:Uncharacterized protein n=1 Tax=Pyramidobacter piscolens W5455 TaxID=352165 RepID=A0ABP2HQK8_9BACT|nr:hypothetical protein HMPREF7215_2410 [Pyramidobacter piscolens W5455]